MPAVKARPAPRHGIQALAVDPYAAGYCRAALLGLERLAVPFARETELLKGVAELVAQAFTIGAHPRGTDQRQLSDIARVPGGKFSSHVEPTP